MAKTRSLLAPLLVAALVLPASSSGQNTGRLSRLILNVYGPEGLIVDSEALLPSGESHSAHFNSAFQSQLGRFNVAIASQLATVPLPSPASGFTYEFDAAAGVFTRSTRSFGPILAERAETVGRGKLSFGFNYQRFTFDSIEGVDLDEVPAVFTHDGASPGGRSDLVTTHNDIDVSLDQMTFFGTVGITSRIDLSVAVPLVRTELAIISHATVRRIGTVQSPATHFFDEPGHVHLGTEREFAASGDASGVGDVHLIGKGLVVHRDAVALSAGLDLRLPSGDEDDLLGSGAVGVRPFLALSSSQKWLSTHLNLSYQFNGNSVLAGDLIEQSKGSLPDQLLYIGGVDLAVHDRVTLAFDLLGQVQFDTARLVPVTFTALDGSTTFPDVAFAEGSITQTSAATGIKVNVAGRLLLDANVLFKLDDGGLRDKVTPLVGFEYSF